MILNLKSIKCCAIAIASICCINAQAQTAQTSWVGRMGGAGSDMPTYNSVTTDNTGNVLLIGAYSAGVSAGPATFSSHNTSTFVDGGFSTASLTYTHSNNQFVYKANAAGNVQWVKQIASNAAGGYFSVMLNAVKTDVNGNVYITGHYRADVDLDPGTAVVTPTVGNSAANNMFILKLNAAGDYVWHREFRDVAGATTGLSTGLAMDISGSSICVAFQFTTSKSFYLPSTTTPVASSTVTATGTGLNTGVMKIDTSGNFVWVKQFSTAGNSASTAQAIDVDANGNIYTTGFFSGAVGNEIDFDPAHTSPSGTSSFNAAAYNDIFISKLSSTGNYVWAKAIGGTSNMDQAYGLTLGSNTVYVVGAIASASIDFNPGGATPALVTNMGNSDAFVAAYGLDGSFQWVNKYGGSALDQANGITCLPNGDLYIAGRVSRSGVPLDFDPQTAGNQGLTPFAASTANNTEAYLLKLTGTGNFSYVYTMGVAGAGNTNDYGFAVAAHETAGARSVYTAGSTGSTGASATEANQAQFPVTLNDLSTTPAIRIRGTGTGGATGAGGDIFLHKGVENTCTPTAATVTATACGSYTIGSNTFTTSGTHTATLINSLGCDSVVTLNLTINPVSNTNFTQVACDSFEFGGTTYYQSGNYTDTFTSALGCDSIVTVFLAIGTSSAATLTETACLSYTLGTETYTQTGVYTQTIQNAVGCDSIITLNLTITQPNVSVSQASNVLTAQATGVSYQWINCSNNAPIAGATQQSYTATANGNYAVIITDNNCSDTSDCINVNTVSIRGAANESTVVSVYPNPTDLHINIESVINGSVTISSIDGRIIKSLNIKKGKSSIDVRNFSQGIYFIKVYDMNGVLKEVVKFSKK